MFDSIFVLDHQANSRCAQWIVGAVADLGRIFILSRAKPKIAHPTLRKTVTDTVPMVEHRGVTRKWGVAWLDDNHE
jgi:molybdate-binding protein